MHTRVSRLMQTLAVVLASVLCGAGMAQSPTLGPAKGHLVIVGGGGHSDIAMRRFIALAGGENAKIVYIPTALEDAGLPDQRGVNELVRCGAKGITILHTRKPSEANFEAFIAPLKTATGVWIGGGRHWRLTDAYLSTRTLKELNALLERGGVIGGTSAGATVQGSFMVRGDTRGNQIMVGDHTEGFGFLKNAAIDQHVLRRNRQFDLIPVIEKRPELLGIGLDEDTAIVVHGDQFEVIGESYVAIYDAQLWANTKSDSPNSATNKCKFYFLSPGQRFNLKTRKVVE